MSDLLLDPEVVNEKPATGYAYSDFMDIKLFTEEFAEQKQKTVLDRDQKEQEVENTLFVSEISESEGIPAYLFMTTEVQLSLEEQQTGNSNYQASIEFVIMGLFLIIIAGIIIKKWVDGDRKKRRRQIHDYNINAI